MIITIWKEQALITTIRKETKRTEDLKEAGCRSPTRAVLRALQQINSATIIQGEAAMPVCLSFLSAGGMRRSTLLGAKTRTNCSNMGEPIRTRKGMKRQAQRRTGLCCANVYKRGGENPLI